MDFDMKKWIQDMIRADVKKPLPVLSFPGIQITGNTVEEIVGNGHCRLTVWRRSQRSLIWRQS